MLQKATLGIADIFEQEGLQLSEQDVRKEMDDAARDFQENDQEYDEGRLREQVEEVLKVRHALRCQCMLPGWLCQVIVRHCGAVSATFGSAKMFVDLLPGQLALICTIVRLLTGHVAGTEGSGLAGREHERRHQVIASYSVDTAIASNSVEMKLHHS